MSLLRTGLKVGIALQPFFLLFLTALCRAAAVADLQSEADAARLFASQTFGLARRKDGLANPV